MHKVVFAFFKFKINQGNPIDKDIPTEMIIVPAGLKDRKKREAQRR